MHNNILTALEQVAPALFLCRNIGKIRGYEKSQKKAKKGIDKKRQVWYISQAVASGRAPAAENEKSFEKAENKAWQNGNGLIK